METKNARLGRGAKVPHLSYVGDAEVGDGSNIGAGTIFANYDGVAKHRTTVGRHARTGSNNTFIAPVTIGDGAVTGGGTVVRRDVPPGALAVSAARERLEALPTLIPIVGYSYLPSKPDLVGNPVFSCHETDVIVVGTDLTDFFAARAMRFRDASRRRLQPCRHIPFWSDLAQARPALAAECNAAGT